MSRLSKLQLLALVPAAAVLVLPTAAFAKGGPVHSGSATASCSVTPTPVLAGGDFTVSGSGLPAATLVDVWVTDSVGTQWTSAETSSTGSMSVPGHASYSGAYSVSITGGTKNSASLATCSFSAQ